MMDFEALRDMLPAYALGALDAAERDEVEAALQRYPELRAELATYEHVLGDLAQSVPQIAPPPALKLRIMAAVSESPRIVSSSHWRSYALPAAAAIMMILLAVFLWRIVQADPDPIEADPIAAILENPDARWIRFEAEPEFVEVAGAFVIAPDQQNAVLTLDNLQVLPDQAYQLWIVRGEERLSSAVFNSHGDKTLLLIDLPENIDTYEAFGVTVEPPGGSPEPTGQRVFGQTLSTD